MSRGNVGAVARQDQAPGGRRLTRGPVDHLASTALLTSLLKGRILARMTNRWVRRLLAGLAAACAAATVIACSNYQPNKIAFHFTPIPVTALPNGTPVSFDANTCKVYSAGDVKVELAPQQRQSFEQWLDDIGLTVRSKADLTNKTAYYIGVPLGSVPDSIAVIAKRPGVQDAGVSELTSGSPEDPPFGEQYFGCRVLYFDGTPVSSFSASCEVAAANAVSITLDTRYEEDGSFERWLHDIGGTVVWGRQGGRRQESQNYIISVPLRAGSEARPLIAKQPGVLETSLDICQAPK